MKLIFKLLLINFIFTQSFTDVVFVGAKSVGTAGAVVTEKNAIESAFYNPAALVNNNDFSFYCGSTNLYNLNFLKHRFASLGFSNYAVSFQSFSTSYNDNSEEFGSFGGDLSKETQISISQGIDLLNDNNSTLSIGYNLSYLNFYQARSGGPNGDGQNGVPSGESSSFGLDIGIYSSLRDKINFGVFIKNINSPKIGKGPSLAHFPRRMDLGIGYQPFKELSTNFILSRELGQNESSFRFGFNYSVTKNFIFRSGIQMNPNRLGAGFTLKIDWDDNSYIYRYIDFSYGLLFDPVLGNTSVMDIKVNFGQK